MSEKSFLFTNNEKYLKFETKLIKVKVYIYNIWLGKRSGSLAIIIIRAKQYVIIITYANEWQLKLNELIIITIKSKINK